MRLNELLLFDSITVQSHNAPDADSIASAFALYQYFSRAGKKARLVFGGRGPLEKPSLQRLVEHLRIPLEYLPTPDGHTPDLLLLADCQYGGGNVMPLPARQVAVIDHHVPEGAQPELSVIRPDCGACAGLVRDLLLQVECPPDTAANTALHYGLYVDTQCFAELRNALDRDLLEEENIDGAFVEELKRNNLRLADLSTAAEALRRVEYMPEKRAALVHSPPCDPNLLGFLADMVLQAEGVDSCLIWQNDGESCRYSVRSAIREVKASDLAAWLGNGGGHLRKAGGGLSLAAIGQRQALGGPEDYFRARLHSYFEEYSIIDCATFGGLPPNECTPYRKLPLVCGYVPCAGVFPDASAVYVRMLESDAVFTPDADTYLMIGLLGEVYPITANKFAKSYVRLEESYVPDFVYTPVAAQGRDGGGTTAPSVLNLRGGRSVRLLDHARACKSRESKVLARQMERGVKVFTRWDREQYLLGNPGDWLVTREDDPKDVYVVRKDIFAQTYVPA